MKFKTKIPYYLCITLGLASIIIGCLIIGNYAHYSYTSPMTFGADFYTEIHKVTANIYNKVKILVELIAIVSGNFFIIFGLLDILISITKIMKKDKITSEYTLEDVEENVK